MIRGLVRGVGELLVTAGALVLLFLVWQLFWTDVVADRAQSRTTDALEQQWDAAAEVADQPEDVVATATPADPVAPPPAEAAAVVADLPSDVVALLRVPRFGEEYVVPVLEGTGEQVLQEGVGHYEDAAPPGEVGNFAVAGHRTTWGAPFNPIADLVDGDAVVVETAAEYHVYRVDGTEIVLPTDVRVIAPVPSRPGEEPTEAWLTMTSCHPMFSARERYVVHALLESSTPRVDGPPAALQAAGEG